MGRFTGKTVIVTGSSRGIGRETARAFADEGAAVVVHGRNTAKLDEVTTYLGRDATGEIRTVAGDVTDTATAEALRAEAEALGGCDILINNAGTSMRGRFVDITPEVFKSVLQTNLVGASVITQSLLPMIIEARGSVVFMSSVSGMRGFPGISIYSAAKMGLSGLTESLRAELADAGVHVGIVYAGYTQNDEQKSIFGPDGQPIRVTRPHDMTQREVAGAVVSTVVKRRNEVTLTGKGKLLRFCNRVAPRLVGEIVRRSGGRFHQMESSDNVRKH